MDNNQRPVLVGVDDSLAAFGAVRWAADEAIRLGRPLQVIHAVEAAAAEPGDLHAQRLALDAAAEARLWQPGLRVAAATRWGDAAQVLAEQARHAALIVVGGRSATRLPSLLGSVGTHLAAHAACPVLVIHHAERWTGPESVLPTHGPIVVGTDGSVPAEHALQLALQEAVARHLPVRAVRAWHHSEHWFTHTAAGRGTGAVLDELTAGLEPWRGKFPELEMEARAVDGKPDEVLLAEARDAVMVVVGARGRGGAPDLHHGGTAWQVLQHADGPVLVARPD
ncbi:universal stress protein [Dactylosporangium sp. NPDC051485]|uniref:universal stress protein n=1 Tax=Dactylosporangium sp. NPDC051485 TaxID=3154846 RepID=UPI00344875B3